MAPFYEFWRLSIFQCVNLQSLMEGFEATGNLKATKSKTQETQRIYALYYSMGGSYQVVYMLFITPCVGGIKSYICSILLHDWVISKRIYSLYYSLGGLYQVVYMFNIIPWVSDIKSYICSILLHEWVISKRIYALYYSMGG